MGKLQQQNLLETMTKFYLYGASGHGKVIIDIIRLNNGKVSKIFDDNSAIKSLMDIKVLSGLYAKTIDNNLLVSIGDNHIRRNITGTLNQGAFCTVIHPKTIIDATVSIDVGTVIMAGAVINASSIIGKHCIINTAASIDHDCIIKDYVHISPNATLCGGVSVGELSHIGAGSVIIQGITIGKNVTVGAGSVIINDIPDHVTVVGNPAQIIKQKK